MQILILPIYGHIDVREDRAELFKFIMLDYGSAKLFRNSPHLAAKAKVIARQIDETFQTAGPGAAWHRFLK